MPDTQGSVVPDTQESDIRRIRMTTIRCVPPSTCDTGWDQKQCVCVCVSGEGVFAGVHNDVKPVRGWAGAWVRGWAGARVRMQGLHT